MKNQTTKRSSFSGKIGFVLSAAGASVGLGNIWRFPYLAAKYGGGIFLLIYIILALTFGYTMIMAETSLGRMTKKSPVGAFASFGKSHLSCLGGWINAIIPVLLVGTMVANLYFDTGMFAVVVVSVIWLLTQFTYSHYCIKLREARALVR